MNADRLDIDALQKGLRAEGFSCGPLWPAGTSGKRQVWTDGVVVIRVSTAKTVLSNSVEDELNWARRIGDVVPAQRPIAGPFYLAGSTATVWEWLDGMPAAPEHAAAHGTLLRTLHDQGGRQINGPAIADQLESARARLPLVRNEDLRIVLTSMVEYAAAVLLQANSGCPVLSHGDAHDRNLLVVDEVLHLIDFDSAGWAERNIDVASGMYAWRHNHRSEIAVKDFLAGYGTHPNLPADLLDALVWVRRVRATCTRAAAGETVDTRVQELLSAQPRL